MTDNQNHSPAPFDLGKLIDSAIANQAPQMTDEGYTYTYAFPTEPLDLDVDIEFESDSFFRKPQTINREWRGRYWFDRGWKAEGVIDSYEYDPATGETNVEFTGKVITDLTNKSYLARFLRWMLRR